MPHRKYTKNGDLTLLFLKELAKKYNISTKYKTGQKKR